MCDLTPYSKKDVKKLCQNNNIALKKRWGQHFLFHKPSIHKVINTIVGCAPFKNVLQHNNIWEIGPGLGALSISLMKHSRHLTLFEIDYGLISVLKKWFVQEIKDKKLNIVAGDASKTLALHIQNTDVENVASTIHDTPDIICGNLPYSTGTRMIIEICSVPQLRVPMCIMLQKEAVNRLAAACGNKQYGISTVIIQSMYDVFLQYNIGRDNFYPYAHVDSLLCTLQPKQKAESFLHASTAQINTLKDILKAAFSSRRKQIKNTLYPYLENKYKNSTKILNELAFDETKRAEQIPTDAYCMLTRALQP